jgi:hypothetical protein
MISLFGIRKQQENAFACHAITVSEFRIPGRNQTEQKTGGRSEHVLLVENDSSSLQVLGVDLGKGD